MGYGRNSSHFSLSPHALDPSGGKVTYLICGFSLASSGTFFLNLLVPKEGFVKLLGLALALGKVYNVPTFWLGKLNLSEILGSSL